MNKIRIGGVPEHFNLPWRMGIEEGKFREKDIQLHWSDMGGGTGQMIKGLDAGHLDVAVLLTEGITKAILQGLDAKIIQVYVTTPLHWGIHVPYDSDITSVDQLQDKVFAISREGSGSHLMTYVKAHQEGWDKSKLKFEVVGDIYGGLWALQENKAQAFLWEKYTTHPYTEQKKCRYIDEVVTPWPCFVITVRRELTESHPEVLKDLCEVVNAKARSLKDNPDVVDIISWRYNLRHGQVNNWIRETDWNYNGIEYPLAFEQTISYLLRLSLITEDQTENWKEKLFV